MSETCALYRHFDADGRLLYVGIAADPLKRFKTHMRTSAWRDLIASTTIERLPSRDEALRAEARAIRTEKPEHNIIRYKGPRVHWRRKPKPKPKRERKPDPYPNSPASVFYRECVAAEKAERAAQFAAEREHFLEDEARRLSRKLKGEQASARKMEIRRVRAGVAA